MRYLLALLCTSLVGAASAQPLGDYATPVPVSLWEAGSSPIHCALSHPVREFGQIEFLIAAGGALQLKIATRSDIKFSGQLELAVLDAPWRESIGTQALGRASIRPTRDGGEMVASATVERLLYELEEGRYVALGFAAGSGGVERNAYISPVQFRPAMREFSECRRNLLSFGYDEVRRTSIFFPFDSSKLEREARYRLDRLAHYLQYDDAVMEIGVAGHTDNRGSDRYNLKLAKRRADAVADYLRKKGVSEAKIAVTNRGEGAPRSTNATDRGRAVNRTVAITLFRPEPIR